METILQSEISLSLSHLVSTRNLNLTYLFLTYKLM